MAAAATGAPGIGGVEGAGHAVGYRLRLAQRRGVERLPLRRDLLWCRLQIVMTAKPRQQHRGALFEAGVSHPLKLPVTRATRESPRCQTGGCNAFHSVPS